MENDQKFENEEQVELPKMEQKKEGRFLRTRFFVFGLVVGLSVMILGNLIIYTGNKISTSSLSADSKAATAEDTVLTEDVIAKIKFLEQNIKLYYLNDPTSEELEDGLYEGLVSGLADPYSTYYSAKELQEVKESTEGIYYGIGAYLSVDEDTKAGKITKVMEGSPAEASGLMAEDIIIKIDGEDAGGLDLSQIVSKIKGPENTDVVLTIYRKGEYEYKDFTVTRKKIESPTVTYEMLENNIAHITIVEFDTITTSQFMEKLEQAKAEGMKGMILDLRDNPGGSLTTVVDIAEQFLPAGLVVYTEDKYKAHEEYSADGENEIEVPLVVLVNENSASASEILAGAIKDYKKGTLLGTTTYGKGIVQRILPLSDGSALKLTVSHYYTPKGNDIHGVGVVPDEVLERDYEAFAKDGTDNQLNRAKEILAGEIK